MYHEGILLLGIAGVVVLLFAVVVVGVIVVVGGVDIGAVSIVGVVVVTVSTVGVAVVVIVGLTVTIAGGVVVAGPAIFARKLCMCSSSSSTPVTNLSYLVVCVGFGVGHCFFLLLDLCLWLI